MIHTIKTFCHFEFRLPFGRYYLIVISLPVYVIVIPNEVRNLVLQSQTARKLNLRQLVERHALSNPPGHRVGVPTLSGRRIEMWRSIERLALSEHSESKGGDARGFGFLRLVTKRRFRYF